MENDNQTWATDQAGEIPGSQAAMSCTCGQPGTVGVMHRSEGPCQSVYATARVAESKPVQPPEFCRDHDGELCLDWNVGEARLSVSIGGTGHISWAMVAGDAKACGREVFAAPLTLPATEPAKQVRKLGITLRQAEKLLEFFGGHDCDMTLTERPADWGQTEEGLYVYCTEYPEDGAEYLGPTEVDDDLMRYGRRRAAQAKPDLPGLTRFGWTEAYAGDTSDLVEDANGTYVRFADVAALLVHPVAQAKPEGGMS